MGVGSIEAGPAMRMLHSAGRRAPACVILAGAKAYANRSHHRRGSATSQSEGATPFGVVRFERRTRFARRALRLGPSQPAKTPRHLGHD
ncbi:hypothetical protein GCM10008174_23310 [Methylopila turkensis]|uniref:Uncharacterized protein n=1 Tax=Methylopila turkensis TaxID=1437816 RepID=A0A9W6N7N0_9HYPH|nr:hypothetical protein GCM10008174_23310 [Methylopila turkensis]